MDCVEWLGQTEAGIPSVVFEARTDAGPIFDVIARIDGAVVATALDGRPLEIDPGLHRVTFEHTGRAPIEERLIVREGERNRLLVADWTTPHRSPTSTAPAVTPKAERPIPAAAYVSAAIAGLGFAEFAIAGELGDNLKNDLEASHCAPFCSRDKSDALRDRYIAADIGLGIGIAELATTAVLFLTRPESVRRLSAGSGQIVAQPWKSGAFVGWRIAF